MEISEFSKGAAWAIMPDKFDLLYQKFYQFESGLDPKTIEDYEARINGTDAAEPAYKIENETAIISITGPLTKRASIFSFLFGGLSYQQISDQISVALTDDRARAIVLDIDSPGGVVSGVEGVSDLIYNSRAIKPIIAYTSGTMASAAYWIGSAAEALFADKTATIGSIGVLRIHVDYSEMEKNQGIKTTYLTAGKYKALGNDSEPLSDEAKDIFQQELDYIYSIFAENIARNRDVEIEVVLSKMADGKVFIGNQALDAGLIDNIGNYRMALEMAASMINDSNFYQVRGKAMEITTVEQLIEAFPDFVSEIQAKSAKKADKDARADERAQCNESFIKLLEIQFDDKTAGDFKKLLESGTTPEQFAAIKGLTPEPAAAADPDAEEDEEKKAAMLAAINGAGAENPGAGDQSAGQKDYMAIVKEYQAEHKCGIFEAQRAIDKVDPELRKTYLRRVNKAA
jgi:signal peptide peptidase SppA